ncbi:hypothetical protein ACFFIX_19495 [Metabacillus herbersteinensis]|uniref:DUF4268 domain-containing protein n=1 Tax=Metabacillus herbersteinensis TaxID=283816 RepID=A0ABV6GKB7_9BACI
MTIPIGYEHAINDQQDQFKEVEEVQFQNDYAYKCICHNGDQTILRVREVEPSYKVLDYWTDYNWAFYDYLQDNEEMWQQLYKRINKLTA